MSVEGDPAGPRARVVSTEEHWLLLLVVVVAISILPRLVHLDVPPLDAHDFRQTQTGITVQSFLDHGVKVLRYETPVLGPPWTVPFEFPLFQLLAFVLARFGGLNVDLACRLTGLLCFYLSAGILFALVRRWGNLRLAALTLAFYVLSPFSLLWSRAVLIDYAAVALTLGYLWAVLRWTVEGKRGAWVAAAALGILASLVKLPTVATVGVPVALALGWRLRRSWEGRGSTGGAVRLTIDLLAGLAVTLIPLGAGVLWTRWADGLKGAQTATAFLTSSALTTWNFGTWAQRAAWATWGEIFGRMVTAVVPAAFAVTLPLAFPFFVGGDRRLRLVGLVAVAGVLLPIAVFFNLYWVHDYYLIAVAPFLAVLAGAGLSWLIDRPLFRRRWVWATSGVVACLSTIPCWEYAAPTYRVSRSSPVARLGALLGQATKPAEWIVVQGDDWNPRILYASRRRGFMIRDTRTDVRPLASRPELGALVCRECTPELLALFPRRRFLSHEASWDVYRLWAEGTAPP